METRTVLSHPRTEDEDETHPTTQVRRDGDRDKEGAIP